jgi:hypothetical protein
MIGYLFVKGISQLIATLVGEKFEFMVRRDRIRRNGRPVTVSRREEGHLNSSHRSFTPGNMVNSGLKGCHKGIIVPR